MNVKNCSGAIRITMERRRVCRKWRCGCQLFRDFSKTLTHKLKRHHAVSGASAISQTMTNGIISVSKPRRMTKQLFAAIMEITGAITNSSEQRFSSCGRQGGKKLPPSHGQSLLLPKAHLFRCEGNHVSFYHCSAMTQKAGVAGARSNTHSFGL